MKLFSLVRLFVIAAATIYFSSSPSVAHAQNPWWLKTCPNCFTGENFRAAGIQHAKMQIAAGTYLMISGNNARAAFVKVTGNVVNVCPPTEPCYQELRNVIGTLVDGQGAPIGGGSGEGASLEFIDQQLFGTYRSDPIKPINIPTEYGTSILNNPIWVEDANSAIARVLYIDRGISANSSSVKVGTIVTVVWTDGSKAQFVRTNLTGSFQWAYVPGSARNANGDPINPSTGQVLSAPASGGGSGGSTNYATSNGASSYMVVSEAGYCISRQQFFFNGVFYGEWRGLVRCN